MMFPPPQIKRGGEENYPPTKNLFDTPPKKKQKTCPHVGVAYSACIIPLCGFFSNKPQNLLLGPLKINILSLPAHTNVYQTKQD